MLYYQYGRLSDLTNNIVPQHKMTTYYSRRKNSEPPPNVNQAGHSPETESVLQ